MLFRSEDAAAHRLFECVKAVIKYREIHSSLPDSLWAGREFVGMNERNGYRDSLMKEKYVL